ncbi:MAG: hypothetical protein WC471_05185 [Candidatus Woesearchaeota archaeon]
MDKLKINLENCYGIKKFNCEFNFSNQNIHSIYAPNGIMKTSFAKTFGDLSNGEESVDLIFPDRAAIRVITDENNNSICPEEVFVIEPYNEDFNSAKISSLIVRKELKTKYDKIHYEINIKKELFLKALNNLSGLKAEVESEILDTFTGEDLYACLEKLESEISTGKFDHLKVPYKDIFNLKVVDFLNTPNFKSKLNEYIETFNKLIDASDYFEKGIFNHNNAFNISKNLNDEGFFKAKHTISLNSKSNKKEILSNQEFDAIIEEEKCKILSNNQLSEKFELIDKAITKNADLRRFRNYLENNYEIIPELIDIVQFKKKIWKGYFKKEIMLFQDLLAKYKLGKVEIQLILKQAREDKTEWEKVILIFNKRFFVPFKLIIINREDVILKDEVPTIGFIFKDQGDEVSTDRETLLKVLSSGEKRALYLLNIIFEVEARKRNSQKTIFIIDDIADSFDYKNKYAIIEYLIDISKEKVFNEIILTHNFDFFRTLESRLINYNNCHMIKKTDTHLELINASNIRNPFNNDWKKTMCTDDKKLIASIPFVRNLISYTNGENGPNYIKLSSVLHIKANSKILKLTDIEAIFKEELHNPNLHLNDSDRNVLDVIFKLADDCLTTDECPNLENKIILSIAIRLKSEIYMIKKINDEVKTNSIIRNQTIELSKLYAVKFPADIQIEILEQVNLMTPENIHLNSFMYEPILDLSEQHLIELYRNVKTKLI